MRESESASPEVAEKAWQVHADLPERQLILGIDRLDYSKGIPQRMLALERALIRYPDMQGKVTFILVVVPSREDVPEYNFLKREIERLVGRINGRFTRPGWTPIHFIYRSLTRTELLAFYRTCEIALITPLKDGMNLVAKEFCACSVEEESVLILSEFAGAAAQLQRGAILVNPYDLDTVADAIYQSITMDGEEKRRRMRLMRRSIRENTVFRWVDSFLKAAFGHDLDQFPPVEESHRINTGRAAICGKDKCAWITLLVEGTTAG